MSKNQLSPAMVMQVMQDCTPVFSRCWQAGACEAVRMIEEPNETQSKTLKAIGYEVNRWVFQKLARYHARIVFNFRKSGRQPAKLLSEAIQQVHQGACPTNLSDKARATAVGQGISRPSA